MKERVESEGVGGRKRDPIEFVFEEIVLYLYRGIFIVAPI